LIVTAVRVLEVFVAGKLHFTREGKPLIHQSSKSQAGKLKHHNLVAVCEQSAAPRFILGGAQFSPVRQMWHGVQVGLGQVRRSARSFTHEPRDDAAIGKWRHNFSYRSTTNDWRASPAVVNIEY
jgi:hypothetical protein